MKQNTHDDLPGEMNTIMTRRVFVLHYLFFSCFLFDVNAKPVVLEDDSLLQRNFNDKNALRSLQEKPNARRRVYNHTIDEDLKSNQQYLTVGLVASSRDSLANQYFVKPPSNSRSHRRRRWAHPYNSGKLTSHTVTWGVKAYHSWTTMSHSVQREIFRKAFKAWADHSSLTFVYESDYTKAVIVITFQTVVPTGSYRYDTSNIISSSYFPNAGSDIYFKDSVDWRPDASSNKPDLLSHSIHAIGHSLGLGHSNVNGAIMMPYTPNGKHSLSSDDIAGVQYLYGSCIPDKVDAVLTLKASPAADLADYAWVFKGDRVWKVRISTGAKLVGPYKVSSYYNGYVSRYAPFTAVLEDFSDYMFMTDTGYILLDGYSPRTTRQHFKWYWQSYLFSFLKNKVPDTAFTGPNSETYVFVGSQFYKFWWQTNPKSISSDFPGLPSHLEAGFYYYKLNEFFFIKAGSYYRKNSTTGRYYVAGKVRNLFPLVC